MRWFFRQVFISYLGVLSPVFSVDFMGCTDPIRSKAKKVDVFLEKTRPTMGEPGVYKFQPYLSPSMMSKNHIFDRPEGQKIECLILHHTAENLGETLRIFTNGEEPRVNAHYIITEPEVEVGAEEIPGGKVIEMMDPENLARHAGLSSFREKVKYNDFSIGIELVGKGLCDEDGRRKFYPYHEDQIEGLLALLERLCKKYDIARHNIFSHSDIAPQRKNDVTIAFPWKRLYSHGFGMGLREEELEESKKALGGSFDLGLFIEKLKEIGYDLSLYNTGETEEEQLILQRVFDQFYAHFSRNGDLVRWSGEPDGMDLAWAVALAKKYPMDNSKTEFPLLSEYNISNLKKREVKEFKKSKDAKEDLL